MKLTTHIFCVRQIRNSRERRISLPLYKSYCGGIRHYYVPYLSLVALDVIGTIFYQVLNIFINVSTLLVKLSRSIRSFHKKR